MENEKTIATVSGTFTVKVFEAKNGKQYKALFCGDRLITFDRLIIWRMTNGGVKK